MKELVHWQADGMPLAYREVEERMTWKDILEGIVFLISMVVILGTIAVLGIANGYSTTMPIVP